MCASVTIRKQGDILKHWTKHSRTYTDICCWCEDKFISSVIIACEDAINSTIQIVHVCRVKEYRQNVDNHSQMLKHGTVLI